jgi:hypothetical protein
MLHYPNVVAQEIFSQEVNTIGVRKDGTSCGCGGVVRNNSIEWCGCFTIGFFFRGGCIVVTKLWGV